MPPKAVSALWPTDWAEQIAALVVAQGYPTISAYIAAHPSEGFNALAQRLNGLAPSSMLSVLYYREAFENGTIRDVAFDGLLRMFRDFIPTGWKNYDESLTRGIREVNMAVSWEEDLDMIDDRFAPLVLAVDDALWAANPPKGWLPASSDDPLLREAFAFGWPESATPMDATPPDGSLSSAFLEDDWPHRR